jgi:hypothetical protein
MKRLILALAFAATGAALLAAQDVKSETKIKTDDDAKPVMFTGCLQTGTTSASYILENAVPLKQETKTETQVNAAGVPQSSTTSTNTTYALVPQGSVEFQQNVGHKVEVTAMMVPAGNDTAELKTQTKTEIEGAPDRKVESKEKVEQGAHPQLRVVSIKHLADRCLP